MSQALPWWWDDVKRVMASYGIPVRGWLPIVMSESGGDAGAVNLVGADNSYGLFQLNRKGGLGSGKPVIELTTPASAADIAGRQLASVFKQMQGRASGFDWWAISRAGWPGATVAKNDPRVTIKAKMENAIGNASSDEEAWSRVAQWRDPDANTPPDGGIPGGDEPGGGWFGSLDPTNLGTGLAEGVTSYIFDSIKTNAAVYGLLAIGIGCIWIGAFGLVVQGTTAAVNSKEGQAAYKLGMMAATKGRSAGAGAPDGPAGPIDVPAPVTPAQGQARAAR